MVWQYTFISARLWFHIKSYNQPLIPCIIIEGGTKCDWIWSFFFQGGKQTTRIGKFAVAPYSSVSSRKSSVSSNF